MKTFKKTFLINADSEDVWSALTNPKTIELWSGYPAVMNPVAGAEFSLWDGDISGNIIEAVENKKLIEEWYFGDQEEKSIVSIYLTREFGSTQVIVEHTNIPDKDFDNIAEGWREYIMGAIQLLFNPNF